MLRGKEQVKCVIHKYIISKKLKGILFNVKYLPKVFADEGPPFTHVGIDFAGPLFVKSDKVFSESIEMYACLFTCASLRQCICN